MLDPYSVFRRSAHELGLLILIFMLMLTINSYAERMSLDLYQVQYSRVQSMFYWAILVLHSTALYCMPTLLHYTSHASIRCSHIFMAFFYTHEEHYFLLYLDNTTLLQYTLEFSCSAKESFSNKTIGSK